MLAACKHEHDTAEGNEFGYHAGSRALGSRLRRLGVGGLARLAVYYTGPAAEASLPDAECQLMKTYATPARAMHMPAKTMR